MDDLTALAAEVGDALSAALAARDPEGLRRFLAPDVRWGDAGHPRSCYSPDEVIATMRNALALGVDATLGELVVGTAGLVAPLRVEFPGEAPITRYQVYVVAGGLVTEIRPFDDEADALAAAGAG